MQLTELADWERGEDNAATAQRVVGTSGRKRLPK